MRTGILFLSMMLLAGTATGFAQDANGTCGEKLTWTLSLSDSTLTVSGTGEMENYDSYHVAPWYSNRSSIARIVIEEGATSIGNYAFSECSSLTEITIPTSVTSIGVSAFYYCSSLTEITIPGSVTSIGMSAFFECSSLTEITIPNSVTSIGDDAFSSCSSLTDIIVENENGYYSSGNGVLFNKDKTILLCYPVGKKGEYTVPVGVTSIGDRAFIGCSRLTEITIPTSVTSIGDQAFVGCRSLTEITILVGVTSIGDQAFSGCSRLTEITIPTSVTSIRGSAFAWCSSLTSVTNLNPKPQEINSNVFFSVNIGNVSLYVPAASIETYRTTAVWQDFKEIK